MDFETSEAIEGLSVRIDSLGVELRAEMAAMRNELRGEIRGTFVQVKSMRDDELRKIAQTMFALIAELDKEFQRRT